MYTKPPPFVSLSLLYRTPTHHTHPPCASNKKSKRPITHQSKKTKGYIDFLGSVIMQMQMRMYQTILCRLVNLTFCFLILE